MSQAISGRAGGRGAVEPDGVGAGVGVGSGDVGSGLTGGGGGGVGGGVGGGLQSANVDLKKTKRSVDETQGKFVESTGISDAATNGFDSKGDGLAEGNRRLSVGKGGFVERGGPIGDGGEEGECEDLDGDGLALPFEVRVCCLQYL